MLKNQFIQAIGNGADQFITIAANENFSSIYECQGMAPTALFLPFNWTDANISFLVGLPGNQFDMAYMTNYDGTLYEVAANLIDPPYAIGSIISVNVLSGGRYGVTPGYTLSGPGTGASLSVLMRASSDPNEISYSARGTGYVEGEVLTIAGGTGTDPLTIIVDTLLFGGAIDTSHVLDPGSYSVVPTNPVSQSSTTGSGTGAQLDVVWEVYEIDVVTAGAGYDETSIITIDPGVNVTATASLNVSVAYKTCIPLPPSLFHQFPTIQMYSSVSQASEVTVYMGQTPLYQGVHG